MSGLFPHSRKTGLAPMSGLSPSLGVSGLVPMNDLSRFRGVSGPRLLAGLSLCLAQDHAESWLHLERPLLRSRLY
jgi:hypothetical protein